jgi:hypothetical protein
MKALGRKMEHGTRTKEIKRKAFRHCQHPAVGGGGFNSQLTNRKTTSPGIAYRSEWNSLNAVITLDIQAVRGCCWDAGGNIKCFKILILFSGIGFDSNRSIFVLRGT